MRRARLCLLFAFSLAAGRAHGQEDPNGARAPATPSKPSAATQPAPSSQPRTVEGLTVTGQDQTSVQTTVDRRSYSLAKDLGATTGSVADALGKLSRLATICDAVVLQRTLRC